MAYALILIVASLISFTAGSKILIDANPDVIQSNLTKSMTLRCSLNDTDPVPTGGNIVGKRDVQYSPENMQTLTSIVITRNNGDPVASLITGQQPKAQTDLNKIQVSGSLSVTGAPGEEGYIEVTWNTPTTAQAGEYVCEINAINGQGHPVTFKETVEVIETAPTIGQLIGYIQNLTQTKDHIQEQINALTHNISSWRPPTPASSTLPHIETGRLECENSENWGTDNVDDWAESMTVYKTFHTPYSTPPHVHISANSLDHSQDDNIRYDITVTNVNNNGFSVKCKTWAGSKIYHIYIDYIAIQ